MVSVSGSLTGEIDPAPTLRSIEPKSGNSNFEAASPLPNECERFAVFDDSRELEHPVVHGNVDPGVE